MTTRCNDCLSILSANLYTCFFFLLLLIVVVFFVSLSSNRSFALDGGTRVRVGDSSLDALHLGVGVVVFLIVLLLRILLRVLLFLLFLVVRVAGRCRAGGADLASLVRATFFARKEVGIATKITRVEHCTHQLAGQLRYGREAEGEHPPGVVSRRGRGRGVDRRRRRRRRTRRRLEEVLLLLLLLWLLLLLCVVRIGGRRRL